MQCLQLEIAAQLKFRLYTKMELTKKLLQSCCVLLELN